MGLKCCVLLLLLGTGVAARSQQSIGSGLPLPNGLHALAPPGFPLVFSNPACRDSGIVIATALTRLHNLPGLGHRYAGLAFDAGGMRWSVSVLQQGSRHFYRQMLGFSLANRIDRNTVLGFGLYADAIRQTSIFPGNPKAIIRAGLQTRIGRKTDLGMRLHTGLAVKNAESPPQLWHLALMHSLSDKLQLLAELEAQSGHGSGPATLKTALSYNLYDKFRMFLGNGGKTNPFSIACTWKKGRLLTTLTFDYHRLLGFTPQCMLVWQEKS